jgi:hypothetical protein
MLFIGLGLMSTQASAHIVNTPTGILAFFTPETVIQKQWNAYNSRNINAYVNCFSEDVEVYMFPKQLLYKGKDKLREHYENFFQITPDLYGEVQNRSVNGNVVKEEVLITRAKKTEPAKATIVYEVEDGLITKMYFL